MSVGKALRSADLWTGVFVCGLIGAAVGIREVFDLSEAIASGQTYVTELTELQEKQLELFNESNKLLTTLATVSFGALGALVFHRYKDQRLPKGQVRRAMTASVALGFSLFAGYVAQERVLTMLDVGFFDLFNRSIYWPTQVQFWSFLTAALVLGLFVHADFNREYSNAENTDTERPEDVRPVVTDGIGGRTSGAGTVVNDEPEDNQRREAGLPGDSDAGRGEYVRKRIPEGNAAAQSTDRTEHP
jgi:hypothetical protein